MYDEDIEDIPRWLRWTFVAINRVGFPIVAFILMWYMCEISISKVVVSVNANTLVLTEVQSFLRDISVRK